MGTAAGVVGGATQQPADVRRAIDTATAVDVHHVHRVHGDALVLDLPPLEVAEHAEAVPRAAVRSRPLADRGGRLRRRALRRPAA